MTNVTLGECLLFAYALASQDQIAGPEWIKVRDTQRPFSFLALVPAKNGPKLVAAASNA